MPSESNKRIKHSFFIIDIHLKLFEKSIHFSLVKLLRIMEVGKRRNSYRHKKLVPLKGIKLMENNCQETTFKIWGKGHTEMYRLKYKKMKPSV